MKVSIYLKEPLSVYCATLGAGVKAFTIENNGCKGVENRPSGIAFICDNDTLVIPESNLLGYNLKLDNNEKPLESRFLIESLNPIKPETPKAVGVNPKSPCFIQPDSQVVEKKWQPNTKMPFADRE